MKCFAMGLLAVAAAFGGPITIVSATGTGNGQAVADWIGETWTQTGTYTNVTISATLNGGVASASMANVYLMNQLGPGTTAAANQIAFDPATIPTGVQGITVFTGLTLGPGTYYLLADETSAGWTGTTSPTYTTDAGITNISAFINNGAIQSYSPDTAYKPTSGAFLFTVTGTPATSSAVPEPATFTLLIAPLALLVFARRK